MKAVLVLCAVLVPHLPWSAGRPPSKFWPSLLPCSDIAFEAKYVGEGFSVGDAGRTMPFNVVVSNVGGGYDSQTSTFTAPIYAFYEFSVKVRAGATNSILLPHLMQNGDFPISAGLAQGPYATANFTATTLLKVGDKVTVTLKNLMPGTSASVDKEGSSFSGRPVRCV